MESPTPAPSSRAVARIAPHVCNGGWVSMQVEVLDPDTGEETFEEAFTSAASARSEARGWRVPTGSGLSGSGLFVHRYW
jgi:hypothetical protein